jgi:uncharacterized protein DUF4397/LysM domain-containing protein
VLGFCLCLLWPAQSFAKALVRFVHAVPGVGTATVDVSAGGSHQKVGSIAFGQVTPFASVRSGSFRWTLSGGGKTLATGTSTVGDGAYDIAILANPAGSGVKLAVYRSASTKGKMSLLRMIHAAPELGSPMFMLDQRTLANRLPYTHATRYYAITPGMYELSAMKPWLMKPGDPTLADAKGVRFSPGVAYTAIAVGSRGQRVRVVRIVDRGAPLTRPATFISTAAAHSMHGSSMASGKSLMVRPGDSLWSIAAKLCGPAATEEQIHAKLVSVWNMNAKRISSGDPNLIFPGTRLTLPA